MKKFRSENRLIASENSSLCFTELKTCQSIVIQIHFMKNGECENIISNVFIDFLNL